MRKLRVSLFAVCLLVLAVAVAGYSYDRNATFSRSLKATPENWLLRATQARVVG